jgi:hypothetical protein
MASLTEVQRLIGLSLNKLQMGRAGRGGLSLHKNLLVATVLNKARDVYMQETMYMNYRLMACGQFSQDDQEEMEDEDTPDTEDYEEDSESDVDDDSDNLASKDYSKEYVGPCSAPVTTTVTTPSSAPVSESGSIVPILPTVTQSETPTVTKTTVVPATEARSCPTSNDEGFIDETDCDCDARNYRHSDGENRVPFQYCFNCAPFHPSNGRGPTLVCPQSTPSTSCLLVQPTQPEPEDKLIYDMDSKSTQNQPASGQTASAKRKRQISSEETEDAINSILPKKRRDKDCEDRSLDDSGFIEEEEKIFHPAFRGQGPNNGMEVDQITSLVSIFSFGQQLFTGGDSAQVNSPNKTSSLKTKKDPKDEDDSDSDSDTSSDSGHSSDDPDAEKKAEEKSGSRSSSELLCCSQAKDTDLEVSGVSPVAAAV